ncbi:WecB/TagA/CpsF family glycosyltransferase [Aureimonas populi]|uniref:WecB/TagA/CpsF family glycosyltransferase n=1 Tax=Aureimonas populi TaxID=1701758 RepID=A0ABW5CL75_9HYPH|nr:WecB/TagA/CpsF family glycosyltransferase [Aureimonas populi]
MHCLFVTSLLPEPVPETGFEIANASILSAFRAAGARLTLAGFRRPGSTAGQGEDEILLGEMAIENARVGAAAKGRWASRALAKGLPVGAAKLAVLPGQALLERLAARGPYDAVILNSVQMPAAYPALETIAPTIYVAHNVEFLSARQNARTARGPLARRLYAREARLLERCETRLCAQAGAVLTLSAQDLAPLGLSGDLRAHVLPLVLGRPAPRDEGLRRRDIGLIGTWSWAPNRAGLDWFLAEVAPRLDPGLSVEIAGSLPAPRPDTPPHIRLLGRVPDAQAFVRESRVMALATTSGTGIQLKTLECLEEGMPAVATPAALRGVEVPLPANFTVAENAPAFAEALGRMVAAEREGTLARLDGRAFAGQQGRAAADVARRALDLAGTRLPSLRIGKVRVAALSLPAALELCRRALEGGGLTKIAFANAHCVNVARGDAAYAGALSGFTVLPDGIGVDLAARLLYGCPFPANLNGTDFVPQLLREAGRPLRVGLLGGAEGVAREAAAAFSGLAPGHRYEVLGDGFFDAPAREAILRRLEEEPVDLLLVAMGVPAQERFIAEHVTRSHARLALGVGALFDFMAQRVPRAPERLRRLRLEWAYRLAREPRRLFARYVLGNPSFLWAALRQKAGRS